MRKLARFGLGALVFCVAAFGAAAPEDEQQQQAQQSEEQQEEKPPPELTDVTGRFVQPGDAESTAGGGIAYFIFQRRLSEVPHDNALEKVRDMAETAVAVDEDGSFSLQMAPGNFALVYDPQGEATDEALQPGPESFAVAKRMSTEQQQARIAVMKENAQKGLAIQNGRLGEAFVIENRFVRPPVTDFGQMELGADHSVTVVATSESGEAPDFPLALRLRGKNGDIFEPHPPSVSEPGQFVFHDVFPQEYEVFAIGQRPKPGMGDDITTPSLKNNAFLFESTPKEIKVTVMPGTAEGSGDRKATPTPAPTTRARRR
jgi:hypothetical protein